MSVKSFSHNALNPSSQMSFADETIDFHDDLSTIAEDRRLSKHSEGSFAWFSKSNRRMRYVLVALIVLLVLSLAGLFLWGDSGSANQDHVADSEAATLSVIKPMPDGGSKPGSVIKPMPDAGQKKETGRGGKKGSSKKGSSSGKKSSDADQKKADGKQAAAEKKSADEKKKADEKKAADDKKKADDQQAAAEKKSAGDAKKADEKKEQNADAKKSEDSNDAKKERESVKNAAAEEAKTDSRTERKSSDSDNGSNADGASNGADDVKTTHWSRPGRYFSYRYPHRTYFGHRVYRRKVNGKWRSVYWKNGHRHTIPGKWYKMKHHPSVKQAERDMAY